MANFGQAMYVGDEVIVECGEKMTCCEREQAKSKCEKYNKEIEQGEPTANTTRPSSAGPLNISPPGGSSGLSSTKCTAQAGAWRQFRDDMNNASSKKEREDVAKRHCASPCLAEQIAAKWRRGRDGSRDLGAQMDHEIEVKWGGSADPSGLSLLGSRVNNFFGSIAKRVGDDMLASKKEDIAAIHFDCPGPCTPPHDAKPPDDDFSTGPASGSRPYGPANAPARTYLQD